MRQIVLDTETTGLETAHGHRIIEVGCVELVNRRLTGNHYHHYLQPEREIDQGAMQVHGITQEFLADKPRFADIAQDLLAFLGDAELIIHNAPFDMGFLNYEFRLLHGETFDLAGQCGVLDTLTMARKLHPGLRNSLDALCKRYDVDNSGRELHGALLDAEILADVYLAMTGGQASLSLDASEEMGGLSQQAVTRLDANRPVLRIIHAGEDELNAHEDYLSRIERDTGFCVWRGINETTH
ncbi:MAG: DNA polymerase III subunit epsilon [Gammaproteobacteria bacterium]|nr:MAG: DNA polymerase III subunit epsilon [Gammaproteobacteria bacterium]